MIWADTWVACSEEVATVGGPPPALLSANIGSPKSSFVSLLRTARSSFCGGASFGQAMTTWYAFLNRIKLPSPTKALMYRVWLDQAIVTPVVVAFFYGSMSILEGKPEEATSRIKAAYVPTIVRNWAVYIPTQLINFSIVPPHLRFFTVSVVSLFWNTYLSASNARVHEEVVVEVELEKARVD